MASPKPILTISLAVVGVLVVALAFTFYFAIWPWIAPPPAAASTIDSRWRQVERWAAYDRDCKKDPITDWIGTTGDTNNDAYKALVAQKTGYPRLDKAKLSAEAQAALRALEDWSNKGGGFVPIPGRGPSHHLGLYNLARVALATATALDDPAVSSALHTAKTLRRCGEWGVALAGFGLSDALVRWLDDRGLRADARFAAHRPTRDELFVEVARETVSAYEDSRGAAFLMVGEAPLYTLPFFDADRELAWLKYTGGERLFAANGFGRDPAKMAALFPSDEDALPKSALVRMHFVFAGPTIDKAAKIIERYDAALR